MHCVLPEPLLCLVGPTAVGKSALALELCEALGLELVSLDSMQVYRGMDVGTAKPSAAERAALPHHMLDLVEPDERYDIARYLEDLGPVVEGILERGHRPLYVGGTGLWLKCLTFGLFDGPPANEELRAAMKQRAQERGAESLHAELVEVDPASAQRIHHGDVRRVVRALEVFQVSGRTLSDWQEQWRMEDGAPKTGRLRRIVGLQGEVPWLDARIRARTEMMLDGGWAEEAGRIRAGSGFGPTASKALGYSQVLGWIDGELSRAQCAETIALRTRQFARRQRTWYRKFEDIHWLDVQRSSGSEDLQRARVHLEGDTYD